MTAPNSHYINTSHMSDEQRKQLLKRMSDPSAFNLDDSSGGQRTTQQQSLNLEFMASCLEELSESVKLLHEVASLHIKVTQGYIAGLQSKSN